MTRILAILALTVSTAASAAAAPTDLLYVPTTSSGHDFNHAPVGQSFTATASDVHGGIFLADSTSFTAWLSTIYPGIAPSPYAVTPFVTMRVDLLAGEGVGGAILHSTTRVLAAPFIGVVDVDYGAAGVMLAVGQKYTILLTDVSGQIYPQGVTGWVVPAVTDPTPGAGQPVLGPNGNVVGYSPYGAYYGGLPVLQGALVQNDAGIGDNAFEIIDNGAAGVQTVSGVNAVITAFAARNPGFIVINGGMQLLDHLWTNNLNPSNTTFLGGLVNWFQTGLLVDYSGTVTPQGVLLTQLTVKPAPAALVVSGANLPNGSVGAPYSASITVLGGLPPLTVTVADLPPGLGFDGVNITGVPMVSGVTSVTIAVTDALGQTASANPTLTINPAPANYTARDEGQGKISAIGTGYLLVGAKKLVWDSTTVVKVNRPSGNRAVIDAFVKVGMRVQWKGLRDRNTGIVLLSQVEIN